jgi:hypothetical protein
VLYNHIRSSCHLNVGVGKQRNEGFPADGAIPGRLLTSSFDLNRKKKKKSPVIAVVIQIFWLWVLGGLNLLPFST